MKRERERAREGRSSISTPSPSFRYEELEDVFWSLCVYVCVCVALEYVEMRFPGKYIGLTMRFTEKRSNVLEAAADAETRRVPF